MAIKRLHKKLIIAFCSLSALLLLFINAFLIWVITGPRSLEFLTPYIESELNATDGTYKVKIGSSLLSWDGWEQPVGIHVQDVKVTDTHDKPIAAFPDVGVRINLFKLLVGVLDIDSLDINKPAMLLYQAEDGSVSLGFAADSHEAVTEAAATTTTSLPAALVAFSSGKGDTPITRLKSIAIREARIGIHNARSGMFFRSNGASMEITRVAGTGKGNLVLPTMFGDKLGRIEASFVVDGNDKSINAQTRFANLPSALLSEIFPLQTWMKSVNLPLAGAAVMKADFEGHIRSLAFNALAGEGVIEYPSEFNAPLNIKKIQLEGELSDRFRSLKLKTGVLDLGDVVLNFDGHFRKENEQYAADASIRSENIPVDRLNAYWPKSVSPHTREWVITRISKGLITRSDVKLHFKPGEFDLPYTPKDAIAAAMDVKGISVLYMPKHPPVTDVEGHIEFTGSTMHSVVSKASYMTGAKIHAADIKFPDLSAADVPMFLEMQVDAPAIDVQTFLDLPNLDKARKLGLTKEISGKAVGTAKLDFIAFSENEAKNAAEVPEINYALTAKLEKVTQPKFLGKYDVSNADMNVSVNNKGIKADGKAEINRLPMDVVAESLFNATHDTNYSLKLKLPVERMVDFDLPKLDFLKGEVGVEAKFVSTDTTDLCNASLDLTHTGIALESHGYTKRQGDKAHLDLATERLPSGNTRFSSFKLSGDNYEAAGSAEIDKKSGEFQSISFSRLSTGKHDLDKLEYIKTPTGIDITARGKSLDLSPYLKMDKAEEGGSLKADVKVDKAVLGEKRELYNISAKVNCPDACDSVEFASTLADKTPFTYSIRGGQVAAACENAGELLRALNVHEQMYGGKIILNGQYEGKKIVGKVVIKDYTLKDAPILTRMFTIASLTGILDTLTGNGISFDRLSAPYVYDRGNITVKDAKQYGSALGITANGSISMPKSSYDLSGTLVPSYTLNSLVGKIPLLGSIIVGGEGKGLIALNYTVKGSMDAPDVMVNPLSVLTPGFLRGIFDVFDEPAPSKEKLQDLERKITDKMNTSSIDK